MKLPIRLHVALLAIAVLANPGCSAFQHAHFVRAHNPESGVTNYFRVNVSGSTFFSLTAYRYGWYDDDAINDIYGSLPGVKQSDPSDDIDSEKAAAETTYTVFDGNGREIDASNNSLVVFLHADADYLAEQLSSLANDQDLTNDIIALVNREELEDAAVAEAEASRVQEASSDLDLDTRRVLTDLHSLYAVSTDPETRRAALEKLWASLSSRITKLEHVPSAPEARDPSSRDELKKWWTENKQTVGKIQ